MKIRIVYPEIIPEQEPVDDPDTDPITEARCRNVQLMYAFAQGLPGGIGALTRRQIAALKEQFGIVHHPQD